jgi:hypothetical protein
METMEDQAPSPTEGQEQAMASPFLLHFRCFDRKGRQGERVGALYDLYLVTEHIVAVRAGFMPRPKSDFDSQLDAMRHMSKGFNAQNLATQRPHADDPLDNFEPDPSRTTIIMTNGDKHMVEGALIANAARVMTAKTRIAMLERRGMF